MQQEKTKITELNSGEEHQWIGFKIRMAQILAFRAFEEKVKIGGKAARYFGLLGYINANPGQLQTVLAEAVALRRSSLVAILDQLEKEGLLERRPVPTDRRANQVWLTAEGERVVAQLREAGREHEHRATQGMTKAEVEAVSKGLDKIIANLK